MSDKPISELYRLAALEWADWDAAARMREELKTTFLEKLKNELTGEDGEDLPDSHRERIVKASPEYKAYIVEMVRARTKANRARIQVVYLQMKANEWQSAEANARIERKLS